MESIDCLGFNEALGSEFQGVYCYPKPDPSGDPWFTGTMVTLGILALLCAAGTAYAAVLDSKKGSQKTSPVKVTSNGHTNNAYTNNAYINNAYTKEDGAHLNGGLINGQVSDKEKAVVDTEKALVDKEKVKDDGVHVNGGLINGHVDDEEKAVMDTGKTMMGTGMTNGQNGSVGLKGAVVNGKNEGMKTVNGTAKIGGERPSSEDSLPSQLLLSFSVLRNGRKVLNCDKNSADISCLHGIRVLSITWIVLGHVYVMILPAAGNQTSMWLLFERFTHMGIVGAVLGVDTFFMLSGCLSAFLFLRTTKKTGLTVRGVVLYYVHRVWRLTPLYAVVLLVYTGIFPYLKEGPFQNVLGMDSESNCRDYMHFNLLYVNNLVDVNKMCLGWSWYLSNDMQFSFLAPLVIIPWCFRGRVKVVGFVLAAALIATHCITTGVKVADIGSTFVPDYTEDVYFKPWCRVGPYAVGLILGYILHVTRCKYTMTKMSWILGWTMATAVGLTLVYVVLDNYANFTTEGQSWGAADFAAYESLSRVLWAVCVSWVVFACTTGYGGFVNILLSWSAWIPLSRLSYGVYLVHIIVQYVMAGNAKKYIYLDNWTATELNLSTIVLSFLLSFAFSMLVEAPTLGLEKAVLGKIFGKRK